MTLKDANAILKPLGWGKIKTNAAMDWTTGKGGKLWRARSENDESGRGVTTFGFSRSDAVERLVRCIETNRGFEVLERSK